MESYFKSHDNHRLYYELHLPQRHHAVLIFVHGLSEHTGRYQHCAEYFGKKGYAVYLFDHRGHGKSDGLRSFVDDFNHYQRDLDEFVKFVALQQKTKPIFIIGHSMGGQILLNYVGNFKTPIKGFIASSPNVKVAVKISALKRFLATQLARFFPKFKLPNDIDPSWISHDAEIVEIYKNDKMVAKNITVGLAKEMLENQDKLPQLAHKIKVPALLLHGDDDKICDYQGTKDFFEKLGSKDKKLIIYPGMYHELHNEKDRSKVFSDMLKWLEAHL